MHVTRDSDQQASFTIDKKIIITSDVFLIKLPEISICTKPKQYDGPVNKLIMSVLGF